MKNNIVLIGMMGAGKSTVALELSKKLSEFSLVDMDYEIEKRLGMSITDIFSKFGEEYFRNYETTFLKEISKNDNQIISTGGGVFEKKENREIMKSCGKIFYLKASADTLFDRIKTQTHRPLLKQGFGVEKIREILEKREHNYSKANIIIDTDNVVFYNIINRILEEVQINEQ